MKILVTGAFGYLGGRVSSFLLTETLNEVFFATSKYKNIIDYQSNANVIKINWDDDNTIENACNEIDIIIHTAGMNAQDCINDPEKALKVNGLFTAKLVKFAILKNVKKIIYFSTIHVYDNPLKGSISENLCTKNLHPYSTSNLAGEHIILQAHQSKKIQGIVFRLSNCIGAPLQKNVNCWKLLVNDLCRQIVEHREMNIYSNCKQVISFVPIREVCRLVEYFLELNFKSNENTIFNVANKKPFTILQIAKKIQKRSEILMKYKPSLNILNKDNTNVENLKFKTNKLETIGFNLRTEYNNEIDELLIFCNNNFKRLN